MPLPYIDFLDFPHCSGSILSYHLNRGSGLGRGMCPSLFKFFKYPHCNGSILSSQKKFGGGECAPPLYKFVMVAF